MAGPIERSLKALGMEPGSAVLEGTTAASRSRSWTDESGGSPAYPPLLRCAHPSAGRTTLDDFYAEWSLRQLWETNTRAAMSLAMSSTKLGGLPLSKLRRSHVEGWVKRMDAGGLAPATIKTRVNNVRSVLRAAVRDRAMTVDPGDGVRLPRDRRRDAAMALPTVEQVGKIMTAADPPFRALVLSPRSLDSGSAKPLVCRSVTLTSCAESWMCGVRSNGQVSARSRSARPRTAVSGSCASPTGCSSCCPSASGSTDLARTRLAGSSRPRQDYRRIRTPLGTSGARPAGAPRSPRFTLHDLRHFYASGLIAAGCDVVTVQRALGHAKATTTLNTYAHLWPTAEDRTRKAANGLFAAATADPMTAQRRPNDGPTASDLRR